MSKDNERKEIREFIKSLEMWEFSEDFDKMIADLVKVRAEIPAHYFRVESVAEYGSDGSGFYLWGHRYETDDEMNARIAAIKAEKDKRKKAERDKDLRELARLRQKYPNA